MAGVRANAIWAAQMYPASQGSQRGFCSQVPLRDQVPLQHGYCLLIRSGSRTSAPRVHCAVCARGGVGDGTEPLLPPGAVRLPEPLHPPCSLLPSDTPFS